MNTTSGIRVEKPELTGQRLLLVEDEYYIAGDLCRALKDNGATIVGPVPSLANAMSLAASEDLTCAVLDINLRRESGFKVAEILRWRNVPFIYTTDYESSLIPDDLKGAMHIGKPFRVDELLLPAAAVTRRPQATIGGDRLSASVRYASVRYVCWPVNVTRIRELIVSLFEGGPSLMYVPPHDKVAAYRRLAHEVRTHPRQISISDARRQLLETAQHLKLLVEEEEGRI